MPLFAKIVYAAASIAEHFFRVPRSTSINAIEQEICRRVRSFRLYLGFSQTKFAGMLGVERSYLADIEHRRNPLRYRLAWRLIAGFKLNPHWLALGVPPMQLITVVPAVSSLAKEGDELFTEAYQNFLFAKTEATTNTMREEARKLLSKEIDVWLSLLPGDQVEGFVRGMVQYGELQTSPNDRKAILDKLEALPQNAIVKSKPRSWDALRDALVLKTQERGTKVALAEKFGVSRQAVNEWLSGRSAPSADMTLRLLEWVESGGA